MASGNPSRVDGSRQPPPPSVSPPSGSSGIWIFLPGSVDGPLLTTLDRLVRLLESSQTATPRSTSWTGFHPTPVVPVVSVSPPAPGPVSVSRPSCRSFRHAPLKLQREASGLKFQATEISVWGPTKFHNEPHQSLSSQKIQKVPPQYLKQNLTLRANEASLSFSSTHQSEIGLGPEGLPAAVSCETTETEPTTPALQPDEHLAPDGAEKCRSALQASESSPLSLPGEALSCRAANTSESVASSVASTNHMPSSPDPLLPEPRSEDGQTRPRDRVKTTGTLELAVRAPAPDGADLAVAFLRIVERFWTGQNPHWPPARADSQLREAFLARLPTWRHLGTPLRQVLLAWEQYLHDAEARGRMITAPLQSLERQLEWTLRQQQQRSVAPPHVPASAPRPVPEGTVGWLGDRPYRRIDGQTQCLHRPYDQLESLWRKYLPQHPVPSREAWTRVVPHSLPDSHAWVPTERAHPLPDSQVTHALEC